MMYSVTGQQWYQPELDGACLQRLRSVVPQVLAAELLAQRQPDCSPDAALAFLHPRLQHLPDPNTLQDMSAAVAVLVQAITTKARVTLFGDYDVDGICGTALCVRVLRQYGLTPEVYIPSRSTEGYGPNPQAIAKIATETDVLVTIDCGSMAHAECQLAQELGLQVVVTDHHKCPQVLPPCQAVVNPNRLDDTSGMGELCGTGVVFYVLMAVQRQLRAMGYFTNTPHQHNEPNLRQELDLVALATVADVVPLTGVNRVLVHAGLQRLRSTTNVGLQALMAAAGVTPATLQPGHLGFQLGPRLNAAGRLSDARLGVTLLTTPDPSTAQELAQQLNRLNSTRQDIQQQVYEQALLQAEQQQDQPVILCFGAGFDPGVIGIVAGKLKEKYHRPTIVLAQTEGAQVGPISRQTSGPVWVGSARSIPGVDIGLAVQAVAPVLLKGGGHAMAAGVTVAPDFQQEFSIAIRAAVAAQCPVADMVPRVRLDMQLALPAVNLTTLAQLEACGPFGMGNPEPVVLLPEVIVQNVRTMGQDGQHLRLQARDVTGHSATIVAFGAMQSPLGGFLQSHRVPLSLAGKLHRNTWNGRTTVDVHLVDAWPGVWGTQTAAA